MTVQEILVAARALPPSERAQLIHALWESMPPEEWSPPNQQWLEEVARRSEALERGDMTASPWSEVRQRARREVGLDD